MNIQAAAMVHRTPFQGVAQIIAFNWPKYVVAIPLLAGLIGGPMALTLPRPIVVGAWICAGVLGWWSLASIAASYWIYDRSGLYDLDWLEPLVGRPRRWASIHAGLDEFSVPLTHCFGSMPLAVLDIYDPALMTERSIVRARARSGSGPAGRSVNHRRLPVPDAACDAIFLMLAAHELRARRSRSELFAEVRRILAPGGRAVVVEHLRDGWNFGAFGPGFLHFFSGREWLASFRSAGLSIQAECSITPFVRVFVLSEVER